jgi:pimeloyl-ACP methyl ester carboxylesterase
MTRTGWVKRALQDYRVLIARYSRQRAEHRRAPQTLARRGDARAQARYLAHFRADSIVDDCELIRRALAGRDTTWSVLGQSYGGFCATHYLSAHPEGLREVFVTGGLPPLAASTDDYYRATYPVVRSKTRKHFARYPGDEALAARILQHVHEREVTLPAGGRLTPRRFQQLGFLLGMDDGMETLHYVLESAFCDGRERRGVEPAVSARLREPPAVRNESDLRRAARDVLHAAGRLALGRASDPRRVSGNALGARQAAVVHRRDDLSLDVRRVHVAGAAARSCAAIGGGFTWPMLYDPARLAANKVPQRR